MKHIECVVLDWAGTVVDYGSVAPTSVFVEAFEQAFDFAISLDEARVPMGMGKWDHICALGQLPSVHERWLAKFGKAMEKADVDYIYQTFMPLQIAKVGNYSAPIPGALEAVNWMKAQGIKIGSCSGYPAAVMAVLVEAAAQQGYRPDAVVASDELEAGSRPGPWMALENLNRLGCSAVWRAVKIDDAAPGIAEGLNGGMWTIGIAKTGNAVGLTEAEWHALDSEKQQSLLRSAYGKLYSAGAHYVVDSLAEVPTVIQEISGRVARGERP